MQKLTSADQRKLSDFVRDIHCLDSVQLILELLAASLGMLIGADTVFVARADAKRHTVALLVDNIGPELLKLWPVLVALRHENPAISYHMSHPDAPPLMIGDLLPMSQWRQTAVFNEFYSRLGMQERLSMSLSFSHPDVVGVVAHRNRGSFTERDRSILNLLRHHVSLACVTATARATPACPSIMEAVESLVGGSIVALDSAGKVQFLSDRAQQHFESFFPQERPFHDGLPLTIRTWVRRELASLITDEFAVRSPRPFIARIGERTLRIRIAGTRERNGCVLLLRAEDPRLELATLSYLGLGARSTEVLYWLAKGKTNKEIAVILGIAAETVKAHLKEIYFRLDLEKRATAASMISEVLVGA